MPVNNVIHYLGDPHVPQDVRRRRGQVMESMLRHGTPVILKHMYNDVDVQRGIAKKSPYYDDIYEQTRQDDPISHGVGFVSVEESEDEWVTPEGLIVVSATSPGLDHTKAPKYRGYGPGYLTYVIMPDVAEDMFKLDHTGALIRIQIARVQMGWYPSVNDNDIMILAEINQKEEVVATHERYELKQTNPVSVRGLNRRGQRYANEDMNFGNQYTLNQNYELSLLPPTERQIYLVETDR